MGASEERQNLEEKGKRYNCKKGNNPTWGKCLFRGGRERSSYLAETVDMPPAGAIPYFQEKECGGGGGNELGVKIGGKLGEGEETCNSEDR